MSIDEKELMRCVSFIQHAEKLKDVLRSAYTSSGRQESTAEHTWRLCLMAMVFERILGDIDFGRLLKMCVIHDLGEAIGGDVPAIEQQPNVDKSIREREHMITLIEPLNEESRSEFLALWEEYESGTSTEAVLAKGLDKLETILQHTQGKNPPDFRYEFNLSYGRQYTEAHPLLAALRCLMDDRTRERMSAGR